ncbi:hypothetical protein LDENG_00251860 [Lucifuga dentata]|nr:hypothetical protein LDENG_00251860 [Lucifuga dentata]
MVYMLGPLLSILMKVTTSSLFSSALDVSAGMPLASPCPARWHLFGQRCFAFYPVWSSWSTAEFLCSQTGSNLASLHTPEEKQFVHQLANTHTPLWVGGYQAPQSSYWFWSDGLPYTYSSWANQVTGKTGEGRACMAMKGGELSSALCGELKFYICSTRASSSSEVLPGNKKPANPEMVPGVSLYDVLLGYSESVAEEILHSSSFLRQQHSSRLTERCYGNFIQQEALYLHRVSSILQALISSLKKKENVKKNVASLLLDTRKHYSSTNQSLLAEAPPLWLLHSLQSFYSVVLEDPVYWLVALLARAHLRSFLLRELQTAASPGRSSLSGMSSASFPRLSSGPEASSFYQQWHRDGLKEADLERRYRETIEKYQHRMDVFKAINIFRQHMINQKSLYKAMSCDVQNEEEIRI